MILVPMILLHDFGYVPETFSFLNLQSPDFHENMELRAQLSLHLLSRFLIGNQLARFQ